MCFWRKGFINIWKTFLYNLTIFSHLANLATKLHLAPLPHWSDFSRINQFIYASLLLTYIITVKDKVTPSLHCGKTLLTVASCLVVLFILLLSHKNSSSQSRDFHLHTEHSNKNGGQEYDTGINNNIFL